MDFQLNVIGKLSDSKLFFPGKPVSAVFLTAAQQSQIRAKEAKSTYVRANKIVAALSKKKKGGSKKVTSVGLTLTLT